MDLNLVINAIKAEMKPSMGCTEPVALALAVSRTCEHLDAPTQKLEMLISSNIFKNAYSVQIPNAGTYGITGDAAEQARQYHGNLCRHQA